MKKILLLFAALFVATVANAQFDICVGPKVGYQTTKLSLSEEEIKSDFKGNMTFGIFGRVTIKGIIIQPELLYFKSGKVMDFNTLGDNWGAGNIIPDPKITINQANLALPIFLGYQFVSTPLIKMRANVGPVFYFAVGKPNLASGEQVEVKKAPVPEKMTIGGALNIGIDVWRLTLDVNYSLGLTKVFDNTVVNIAGNEFETGNNNKQNIFTVTLGFKLL